jgi:hypothetical protein
MLAWVYPVHTGRTLLDAWSLVHVAFWFFAGSVLWSIKGNRKLELGYCLAVAYAWEASERFCERRWPKIWINPESFINSVISDPAMCIAGIAAAWYILDHWRRQ